MKGVRELALSCMLVLACTSVAFAASLVDINTASEATLETLTGIGPTKAQAIIDYRTEHGLFTSIDQIQKVSGIGPATYNEIKDSITVSGDSSSTDSESQTDSATSSDEQDQTKTQTEAPKQSVVNSYVAPPSPSVYADAGDDRTVIVGADTEFDASAYDKDDEPITSPVRFSWNFGDGGTAEGKAVTHHFSYPGRYDVVLSIAEDRSAGRDELVVTAEPAALSFTLLPDGGVAITNLAGHDLDLSGWIVKQSGSIYAPQFILPPYSKVLTGSSMQISSATLGFEAGNDSALEYPNGVVALGMGQASTSSPAAKVAAPAAVAADAAPTIEPVTIIHAIKAPAAKQAPAPKMAATSHSQTAAAASMFDLRSRTSSGVLYWAAAIALSLLAGIGTYFLRRPEPVEQNEADEIRGWSIIEENPEAE